MKTVNAPVRNFVSDGTTLYNWLGSFWSQIFEEPELVRHNQLGNGILSAQLYLNFLESIELLDRTNAPVFHRERWYPVLVKRSEANTGTAALLEIGMDPQPVIGPQTNNEFIQDKVLKIGGTAAYSNVVSYPLPAGAKDIMTCVADNIVGAGTVLTRDQDYAVRDDTVFFLRDKDPFSDPNFPRRTVVGADGEVADEEIMLWACDTLFDKEQVFNYIGYVLNIKTQSSEFYTRLLNSMWDLYNQGTPLSFLTAAVGAILGEPTIKHRVERVDTIIEEDDYTKVVTDKEVYRLLPEATLREAVQPGLLLQRGELLSETVRIYDTLDPMKLAGANEYGERLRTDVPSMFFGRDFMRARVQFGIGADWNPSDLTFHGLDSNGNAKLKCQLYGTPEDIDIFWNDFWNYLEENNISSETCFEGYLNDTVVPVEGSVYGSVPPLEYFMRYYLKNNAFIIVVDRDTLTVRPDSDSLRLVNLLKQVLPVHTLMFMVERRTLDSDEYDLSTDVDAYATTDDYIYEDTGTVTNPLKAYAALHSNTANVGGPSRIRLTYTDRKPILKWLPVCK